MSAVRKPLPAAVTADLIARAIVASARSLGQDPIRAMLPGKGTHRRCLGPALVALHKATGAPIRRLAELTASASTGEGFRPRAAENPAYRAALDAALAAIEAARPAFAPAPILAPLARQALRRPASPVVARPRPAASGAFAQLNRLAAVADLEPVRERDRISDGDRALIEAALAAGKVTTLPPGVAAGISQIEQQFHAAPPPAPEGTGWRGQASQSRGSARGTRVLELRGSL